MASQQNIKNLKILTLNVRGLRNKKKRYTLFQLVKEGKYDIIALQETHFTENSINIIENEWGKNFHYSAGTNRSKGLITLFGDSITINETSCLVAEDRMLISSIHCKSEHLVIANIYGPNKDKEKVNFLNRIQPIINNVCNDDLSNRLILLGDFNVVVNNDLDIISGLPHSKHTVETFNSLLNRMHLVDIWRVKNENKRAFSWSCTKPIFTARRLDYILIANSLVQYCKDVKIKNFGLSDHKGVTIEVSFNSFKRGPPHYKFNKQLLKNIEFINEMRSEIDKIETMDLNPHLKWEYTKIQIRTLGIIYGRKKASENKNKNNNLSDKIEEIENLLVKDPTNIYLQETVSNLKKQLELYYITKTEGARVRSRIKWAEKGEKCSKYFLNLEKQKSEDNTITQLQDTQNVNELTDPIDILKSIKNHFEILYSKNKNHNENSAKSNFNNRNDKVEFLTEEDIAYLEKDISEDEVLKALKESKNDSAPGLDGIPCEVYKVLWKDIKHLLLESIRYSYATSNLSTSQKCGLICLIHKGKELDKSNISNWRPLALTNFDYKLIAKTLARRLNTCIDKCIHANQHAFIKGRKISTMLRDIDDILQWGRLNASDNIILSLDYAKAFDTISTNAILDAMKFFGFGDKYIEWIKILLTDRKNCVRNGGYISEFFNMERGVRQGCPISPLLFILTVELLAINIRNDNKIKGIQIPNSNFTLKILQYADDTTLFLRNMIDYREILAKIKEFSLYTGLELNKSKSNAMYISNFNYNNTIKYGIKIVNKIKILGIIFSNEYPAQEISDNFTKRIDQLERICSLWSKRKLSMIGKIVILKTFGISLFTHIMQSIGITKMYLDKINQIFFRFIWKKNFSNTKTSERVKRKTICSPKKHGGLNMIDIHTFQYSFYLDWAERYINNEDHAWKYMADIFLKKLGGINVFKSDVKTKYFKGLESIKSTFWTIVVSTWLNCNTSDNQTISRSSPIFNNSNINYKKETLFLPQCIASSINTVGDMMADNNLISFQEFIDKYGVKPDSLLNYNVVYNAIKRHVGTMIHDNNNNILFRNINVGSLGRKYLYNLIRDIDVPLANIALTKRYAINMNAEYWMLPFTCTSETHLQALQWKILHGIYPSGTLLVKMNLRTSNTCNYCGQLDTLQHFFYDCIYVKPIWVELERKAEFLCNTHMRLTAKDAIIGIGNDNIMRDKQKIKSLNRMILIGKHTISKVKFHQNLNFLITLEQELTIRQYGVN